MCFHHHNTTNIMLLIVTTLDITYSVAHSNWNKSGNKTKLTFINTHIYGQVKVIRFTKQEPAF